MPNTLSTAWVKNVYSLRIAQGVTSGYSSTPLPSLSKNTTAQRVQTPFFTHTIRNLSARLSTQKNQLFNLLSNHLYPLSTAPTIKKNKEKMERNT